MTIQDNADEEVTLPSVPVSSAPGPRARAAWIATRNALTFAFVFVLACSLARACLVMGP